MYKIPLTNSPNQTLKFVVPVNDENVTFTAKVSYNEQAEYWNFSIYNSKEETPIFENLPMLCSQYRFSNLIRQLAYLKIGSVYIAPIAETETSAPDASNLGTGYILVWGDNEMSEYDQ